MYIFTPACRLSSDYPQLAADRTTGIQAGISAIIH